MKVFSRLQITSESLFIGHKLALEKLRKEAKNERACLWIVRNLEENSDIGQFGSYCKGFAPQVVFYWHFGGKKLTPTIKDVNNFIYKGWDGEYKSFEDLPSDLTYYFKK